MKAEKPKGWLSGALQSHGKVQHLRTDAVSFHYHYGERRHLDYLINLVFDRVLQISAKEEFPSQMNTSLF